MELLERWMRVAVAFWNSWRDEQERLLAEPAEGLRDKAGASEDPEQLLEADSECVSKMAAGWHGGLSRCQAGCASSLATGAAEMN